MPFKSASIKFTTKAFSIHGLHLQWPRMLIIILGAILIFICLVILGMEIGHTVVDVYRSTAFGGFILFIPLLICAIFVLLTGIQPRFIFLRIALILCCVMIILCMVLIAYDILVLIDPTRCFFLNCNNAVVNASNSTTNITVTGWPLYITWPQYFQTNMNAKRIFQSIQLLAAALFILCCSLYLLTYYIYRYIRLDQQAKYVTEHRILRNHEINRVSSKKTILHDTSRTTLVNQTSFESNGLVPIKGTSFLSPSFSQVAPDYKVRTYTIDGQRNTSNNLPLTESRSRIFTEPIVFTSENNPLCRRCENKPQMILATAYERENFVPHLCINCNTELANIRQKPMHERKATIRRWRH